MGLVFDISLSPSPSIFTLLRWLPVACTSSCVWWMASHGGAWRRMAAGGQKHGEWRFAPDRPFVSRAACLRLLLC